MIVLLGRGKRIVRWGLLLLPLLFFQCTSLPSTPDKIVFVSYRDGNPEIYTMHVDGSEQKRLTINDAIDKSPSWSPDGEWIVFQSDRDNQNLTTGQFELYVMKSDGSNIRRLTYNRSNDMNPDWSPIGDWIAYESWENGYSDIYLVRPDGSNKTQLTTHPAVDGSPSWSADGENILFDSNRFNYPSVSGGQIFKINIHDLGLTPITKGNIISYDSLSVSPNGMHIAYSAGLHPNISILDVHSINEKDFDRIVPYPSLLDRVQAKPFHELVSYPLRLPLVERPAEFDPSWSPDGKNLVFAWGKGGDTEIYSINVNSRRTKQLTNNDAHEYEPDWWSKDIHD